MFRFHIFPRHLETHAIGKKFHKGGSQTEALFLRRGNGLLEYFVEILRRDAVPVIRHLQGDMIFIPCDGHPQVGFESPVSLEVFFQNQCDEAFKTAESFG